MSTKLGERCEHGDDDDSDTSDTEGEEERVRLWQYTLGRRSSRTDLGELCNTLSHWSGHRDWARAVCTLLPSRRRSTVYSGRFAAATLPAMSRASIEDPDTLNVRRQLSSASHRRRTGSSCLNRALSMRSPGGLDAYDSVFESGLEEPLSEEEQAEMRAAIRSLPVPLAMRRLFR
ncbi:hypothetical protein MTO96_034104 [Rhipicephalus appendiculatus]